MTKYEPLTELDRLEKESEKLDIEIEELKLKNAPSEEYLEEF